MGNIEPVNYSHVIENTANDSLIEKIFDKVPLRREE